MYNSNEIILGKPVAPSHLVESDEKEGFEITVSYGGGMGGSCVKYYALVMREKSPTETIINTIDNRNITITNSFIVRTEPVRLVRCEWDTTAWKNYNKKECNKETQIYWFVFRGNQFWSMSNEIQFSFENRNGGDIKRFVVYQETFRE